MSLPRYTKYNASGVDWLGDVPSHWPLKRLRVVAALNPSKSEISGLDRDVEVSFLPMEAIGDDGSLNLDRTRPIREVETGYTYFRSGDVAVAKITPCFENGKGALMRGLTGGVGFGTTELIVVRPRDGQTTGEFLNWLFRSPSFRLEGEASMYGAGGQKRVPDEFVRNLVWAFPPITEQVSIAAFLDREIAKIDALIAEQEKLLALLAEKRQATISRAVTRGLDPNVPMKHSGIPWLGEVPAHWELRPLKSIAVGEECIFIDGDWIESRNISDEGIRYITTGNVGPGFYKEQGAGYITEETFVELNCTEVFPGDVLISRLNLPIGRACVVPELGHRIVTSVDNVIVRAGADFHRPFVVFRLTGSDYLYEASNLASGATMQRISRSELGRIRLAFPPIWEQLEISRFLVGELGKLDALKDQAEQGVELLKERRSALISAAVAGKIDVRGLVAEAA